MLWGDGSPTREFLYVEDCADGLVRAAELYDRAEPVNLGTGVETSIRELAETVAELTGFSGEIRWDTSMPNGQPRRSLDASKAERAVRLHGGDAAAARASSGRSRGTALLDCSTLKAESVRRVAARLPLRPRRSRDLRSSPAPSSLRRRPEPWLVLVPLLLVQWIAEIVFSLSVHHNGFLYYQGGDQIW